MADFKPLEKYDNATMAKLRKEAKENFRNNKGSFQTVFNLMKMWYEKLLKKVMRRECWKIVLPCCCAKNDKNTGISRCFFGSSRVLGFRVHHPFQGPLTHLCDLEAGLGRWAPNLGGAAPGFEPRTSCMRVRSVTITLRGPTLLVAVLLKYV